MTLHEHAGAPAIGPDPTKDRPRKWWIAGLFGFLVLGLGQLYNGQWRKAVALGAIGLAAPVVITPLFVRDRFLPYMITGVAARFLLQAGAMIEAMVVARRLRHGYALKPFNRVPVYLAVLAGVWLATTISTGLIRTHVVRAFRMPSDSMRPALLAGDFFFANMGASGRRPSRGDLIVHRFPPDPGKEMAKRVVAIGGDTVEVRDKRLLVNGEAVSEPSTTHPDPEVRPGTDNVRDNFGPLRVPPGHYFVLGDNRDNSNDSRYWGPLPGTYVLGTVRGIYWSWDARTRKPRWERIGRIAR